jgi:LmbE family N-acetylglucosaminyl deacetylase
MTEEPKKLMVVTAHPDDAEFSCGGSVAKWSREGWEVTYVISTNGDKGSSDREMTSERLVPIREKEQRAAAAVLGVKEVVFLGYPDGSLEDTPEFRGEIVRQIRRVRPDRVVAMDPYRWIRRYIHHRDHRITGIATLDAVFPYARDHLHYPEHIAEGLEPHIVKELLLSGTSEPNLWEDISDYFELKIKALRCHESQVGHRPPEEFKERLKQMATQAGAGASLPMAEAFRRVELTF